MPGCDSNLFEAGLKVEAALEPASIFLRGPGLFKERDCVAELPCLVAIEEINSLTNLNTNVK